MSAKTVRVRVAATPERGLFRAGRFWSHEASDAEVSVEQLTLLKDEPRLVVVEVPVVPEKPAEKAKG